jgi:hypothetical protein
MLLNLGTGIINSIIEEEPVLPKNKNESKVSTSKDAKKSGKANKREPSSVPSISNHLHPCLLSSAERLCYLDDPAFDQVIHRLITQMESM